jgi:hypothetical protein
MEVMNNPDMQMRQEQQSYSQFRILKQTGSGSRRSKNRRSLQLMKECKSIEVTDTVQMQSRQDRKRDNPTRISQTQSNDIEKSIPRKSFRYCSKEPNPVHPQNSESANLPQNQRENLQNSAKLDALDQE